MNDKIMTCTTCAIQLTQCLEENQFEMSILEKKKIVKISNVSIYFKKAKSEQKIKNQQRGENKYKVEYKAFETNVQQ